METIQLSPEVLSWAAAQAESTLSELAYSISRRNAEKIIDGALTSSQIHKFAKSTGVPLGFLFLDEPPPPRALPVADFRTLPQTQPLKRDFFEVFDDIEYKQAWYRDFLIANGEEPLSFVGKYDRRRPAVGDLAKEIRATIKLTDNDFKSLKKPDDLFSLLAEKSEEIGILVFKNGVVGNNTHKPLSVEQFRGFALADKYAPAIFINGADAAAAWVFTLAHELAHIWLGCSGVSDTTPSSSNSTERYCNDVAAELLIPRALFLAKWESLGGIDTDSKLENIRKFYKVSILVVARRALTLQLINREKFLALYTYAKGANKNSGGGNFYATLATRNSKKFSQRVADLAVSGAITLSYAGRLLNTNPNNVIKFYERQHTLSF